MNMNKILITILLLLTFIVLRNKSKSSKLNERFTLISPTKSNEIIEQKTKTKQIVSKTELNNYSLLLTQFISEIEKVKNRWMILIPNKETNIYDIILYIDVLYKLLDEINLDSKMDKTKLNCDHFDKYCSFETKQKEIYDKKGNYQNKNDYDDKIYDDTYKGILEKEINIKQKQEYRNNNTESNVNHNKIEQLLYEADIVNSTVNKDFLDNSIYKYNIDDFENHLLTCYIPYCDKHLSRDSILNELKFLYDTLFDILIRNNVITYINEKQIKINFAAIYHEEKLIDEDPDPEYLIFVKEFELFLDICRLKLEKIKLHNQHKNIKMQAILQNYINNHTIVTNKKVLNK